MATRPAARSKTTARRATKARPGGAASAKRKAAPAPASIEERLRAALAALEARRTRKDHDNLARFGINAKNALGVSLSNIQTIAKSLGRDHALAGALWASGAYEARLLAAYVDEPDKVTPAQMDRWCRDFDNWGIVDTVCFKLFDQSPHAWSKVAAWCGRREEFQKRAGLVMLACLGLHDKTAPDAPFAEGLRLIERDAEDDRNFVMKGSSWALRVIGGRSAALHAQAQGVATRLAASTHPAARWIGKEALREFSRPAFRNRFARTRAAAGSRP